MTVNFSNPEPVFWNEIIKAKMPAKAIILFAFAGFKYYARFWKCGTSDLVTKY